MAMQRIRFFAVLLIVVGLMFGCDDSAESDPSGGLGGNGPGGTIGDPDKPVSSGKFEGGKDEVPVARKVPVPVEDKIPDCGAECLAYCKDLSLENPVNRGLCTSLWGAGLETRPIERGEGCRRLFVDMMGRFPTLDEVKQACGEKPWGDVVNELMKTDEFVLVQQRRWADSLVYNAQYVSVERLFDIDLAVEKLYRGLISYGQFAAVASAHPVLVRRYDTASDRVAALFNLFMGRPALSHEQADMGRLYALWSNGYYDHPTIQKSLPDTFLRYNCLDENGEVQAWSKGECTSILWGYNELILLPDGRLKDGEERIWSGLLTASEWERLQLPGRILSQQPAFWEKAVDDVLLQYLGYDLGTMVPAVRAELVKYLQESNGDIRAVHFAVLTSFAYLQSARGESTTAHRWTHGPLKQIDAEGWLDTIKSTTGFVLGTCDHRLTAPDEFLWDDNEGTRAIVNQSRWTLWDYGWATGRVRLDYRGLAQSLGGCPNNDAGRRFKTVSILTTATQLNFVNQVCNPELERGDEREDAAIETLIPSGMSPKDKLDTDAAERIMAFQIGRFYGRGMRGDERADALESGEACKQSKCTVEQFARPICFALLSSVEMLVY